MAESQFDLVARWGGKSCWDLGDGRRLTVSEAVQSAGPGQGVAMIPWALDDYMGVLRLSVGEAWLAKVLLRHAWDSSGIVYPSLRKLELQTGVSRKTLARYRDGLISKGYVRVAATGGPKRGKFSDRRWRLDVRNLYCALALAAAADPTGTWAKQQGGPVMPDVVRGLVGHDGVLFNLDLNRLYALAERKQRAVLDDDE